MTLVSMRLRLLRGFGSPHNGFKLAARANKRTREIQHDKKSGLSRNSRPYAEVGGVRDARHVLSSIKKIQKPTTRLGSCGIPRFRARTLEEILKHLTVMVASQVEMPTSLRLDRLVFREKTSVPKGFRPSLRWGSNQPTEYSRVAQSGRISR